MQQNSVKVRQQSTGLEFVALMPYYNMLEKTLGGEMSAGMDQSVKMKTKIKDENGKNNRNDTDVVVEKRMWGSGDCVTFGMDGSISIRSPAQRNIGLPVGVSPGNLTDPEFFLRFLTVPPSNPHNFIQLSLPGAVPAGSKFHFCMKGTLKEQKKEVCRGAFRSESMFWKSRVLGTDAFCTYIYSYVFLF